MTATIVLNQFSGISEIELARTMADPNRPHTFKDLVRWRRDVRRFKRDPLPARMLNDLLRVADQAPSVGNSQPWRIVNVADPAVRARVKANFERENIRAASGYKDETYDLYRSLKLAGFDKAPVHLAIFSDRDALQGHRLGRATMPETLDHSTVCMITLLWLAAREKGVGLGWVSILDAAEVQACLRTPPTWHLVGYLLLGYPEEEHLDPELERAQWQERTPFEGRYFEVTSRSTPFRLSIGESKRGSTSEEKISSSPRKEVPGRVILVGAGPGDPMLLTQQAIAALASADVVLMDDLVADDIKAYIREGAQIVNVGKRGYRPSCKQPDINASIVEHARQGRCVVRLKSGDPLIFGRAGEEITACRDAGISIEIVPGITSAQGAAARLGVSLTHRDHARRLQYITAHDRHGRLPPDIDWSSVADPAATTVVYMPKRTLHELTARALNDGLSPDTPAVAVANATRRNERILRSTVANIATELEAARINGPVLVMIGQTLENAVSRDIPDALGINQPLLSGDE